MANIETTPLTADEVEVWWQYASRNRPLPELGACASLAANIDLCWRGRGRTHRRLPERKIAKALDMLRERIPEAEAHWQAVGARNNNTIQSRDAAFVLERIARLREALGQITGHWLLEPEITVTDLGWQADAKFLYPKVVAAWVRAGHAQSRPHAESPACMFLEKALAHLGWQKGAARPHTAGAIAKMLRDAGVQNVEVEP